MAKTLVTGGTGFIGSHLVERLLKDGREVKVLVPPKFIEKIESDNVELLKTLDVELVEGDLRDKESLKEAVNNVDVVFHAAAISRPMYVPKQLYFDTNELGTKNLLESCLDKSLKKFVHVSTVSVLGVSPTGKHLKEDDFAEPTGDYGESKKRGEFVALDFYKKHKMPVTVVRPPLTYGPRCLCRFVMFRFIHHGLYPEFKGGKALMEFCYVDNLISAFLLAEKSGTSIGQKYNITDGRSYELREVTKAIADGLGVPYPWVKMPVWLGKFLGFNTEIFGKVMRFHPPFSRTAADWMSRNQNVYDCTKAKEELGYSPSVSLREGVKRSIEWYREYGILKENGKH